MKTNKEILEKQQEAKKRIIIAHLKGIIRSVNYCLIRLDENHPVDCVATPPRRGIN